MEDIDTRVTRLEERVSAVNTNVSAIRTEMGVQTGMLKQLTAAEDRRKGALWAVTRIAGLFGSGGLITWAVAWVSGHVK